MTPVLKYLWLCCKKGWRPAWRAGVFGLGITAVGIALFVTSSSPLLILVAGSLLLSAVLIPGGYVAYRERDKAATVNADKAARADHLEKLNQLLQKQLGLKAQELAVSQRHYEVLSDFKRNPPA